MKKANVIVVFGGNPLPDRDAEALKNGDGLGRETVNPDQKNVQSVN